MPPSADVTPGVWGFVAFFVLAVALYLLMRNMNARMRRMSYRQKDAHRTGGEAQANEGDGPAPPVRGGDKPSQAS
ncbi:MAG: hypothetical protein ABI131_13065 [Nostocoides sp.]